MKPRHRPYHSRRALLLGCLAMAACGGGAKYSVGRVSVTRSESERVQGFLTETFLARLDRDPLLADRLGLPGARSHWADPSDAFAIETAALLRRELDRAERGFSSRRLEESEELDLKLIGLADRIALDELAWRGILPLLSTHHGVHRELPAHLLLYMRVNDLASAEAYTLRLESMGEQLAFVADEVRDRATRGLAMPGSMALAARDEILRLYISPAELTRPLIERIESLTMLEPFERGRLAGRCRNALEGPVQESASRLVSALEDTAAEGPEDGGLWRIPGGRDGYQAALRRATTTELTPSMLHEQALSDVGRLHADLRLLASRVGYSGSVEEFLEHMRTHPDLRFAPGDEGREAWLQAVRLRAEISGLEVRVLPDGLTPSPPQKTDWRNSEGGILWVDLSHPERLGPHRVEAFISQFAWTGYLSFMIGDLSLTVNTPLRRSTRWPAWEEGWAFYAMALGREAQQDTDVWSEIGWVCEELLGAARAVADTGLHADQWSTDRAIRYLLTNTAEREVDCRRIVEGIQALPARGCAALVGLQRMRDLRQRVASRLDEDFDRVAFHVALIEVGPLPLETMEDAVLQVLNGP
jgi:uncharacterized protein (DUF885 family)